MAIALVLCGRVPADGLHPGHHRQALPAVRGHDRDLGHHLGLQRPDPQPGAVVPDPEAQERRPAARWGLSTAGSTRCSARRPTATCRLCGFFIRKFVISLLLLVLMTGAIGRHRQAGARRVPARGGPGLPLRRRSSCRTPPRCSARTRPAGRSKRSSWRPRASSTARRSSASACSAGVTNTYSGFFFVTLKPWDERKSPEEKYEAIMASLNRRAGPDPPGGRLRLLAAGHPGHRHLRRRDVHSRGPRRARTSRSCGRTRSGSWPRRKKRPETRAGDHHLPADRAADLRGRRPRQGAQAGGGPRARSTRRCRPSWAATSSTTSTASAGSGRSTSRPRGTTARRPTSWGSSTCATRPATRCRCRRVTIDRTAIRPRVHHALQPLPLGPDQRRRRARLQLRAGDEGPGGGVRRRPCRAEMGYDYLGHELPGEEGQEGVPISVIFASLPALRLPDPGRAVRELVAALQRAAGHPDRSLRRIRRDLPRAAWSSTSTPRSA